MKVPMFVQKNFVWHRFVAQKRAKMCFVCLRAKIRACHRIAIRDVQSNTESVNYLKEHAHQFDSFQTSERLQTFGNLIFMIFLY